LCAGNDFDDQTQQRKQLSSSSMCVSDDAFCAEIVQCIEALNVARDARDMLGGNG
jgi:hypothetical protein